MGLSNPALGTIDLDDWRNVQTMLDSAKAAGLFVLLRPGPYINAETSAGGLPHWMTAEVAGRLRTNDTHFALAWKPYIEAVARIVVANEVSNGGPIMAVQIDNEYTQSPASRAEYFSQLEKAYKDLGVTVPLTYNDPNQGSNFINGTGAVDLYGLDSYPQRFDCSHPQVWNPVVPNYHDYHMRVNPSQPWFFPEFQAGSFDAWGPNAPGYDMCFELTGPEFQQVFNMHLWASNAKLISYYMVYGGTSWGAIPFPGVYTSYDYGAPIRENRALSDKYAELKSQGLFIRSSPQFYKTEWIGDSSTKMVTTTNKEVFGTLLRNPDDRGGFYILRQKNSISTVTRAFRLWVNTSFGRLLIPQTNGDMILSGRESRTVVTDYNWGVSKVVYSTAPVLFAGSIGNRDVIFLYGKDTNESYEVLLQLTGTSTRRTSSRDVLLSSAPHGATVLSFLPGIQGLLTIWDSPSQLVLFSDSDTAATFYAPVVAGNDPDISSNFNSFWQFGSNSTVLVGGAYLVRNATIVDTLLSLQGDVTDDGFLTVLAPLYVNRVKWNGILLEDDASLSESLGCSSCMFFHLKKQQPHSILAAPKLENWVFSDALPEIEQSFSDLDWIEADKKDTHMPRKPKYGDGRVLYGCEYGFCENTVIFRGHFLATGMEHSANLSINGGQGFAASVWINDKFIKTVYGNSSNNANIIEEVDDIFVFPSHSVTTGSDNVVTVIYDNMGLDESDPFPERSRSPRGLRGFHLNGGHFDSWKVQGKYGGYTRYPDKVRGVFNEGGTFAERSGWHLPGYDTSLWVNRDLEDGLPGDLAGFGCFVATFELDIKPNLEAFMSFEFDDGKYGQAYRAFLFVNGWFMGKRVGNLGPQAKFPVHQGILDYNGVNTIVVIMWNMESKSNIKPSLQVIIDGSLEGGVGVIHTNNPVWETRSRLSYI